MIAVDTNILIYAHRAELAKHDAARRTLSALAESSRRWAIPVFCLGEFLRVVTHARLFDPPFTAEEATDALNRVMGSPSLVVLHPGSGYVDLLFRLVREAGAVGNLAFDAQIAAVCLEAGVDALLTEDRDFERFPGLETRRLD